MRMSKKKRLFLRYWPLLFSIIFLPLAGAEPPAKEPVQQLPATGPAATENQVQVPAVRAAAAQTPPKTLPVQPVSSKQASAGKQSGFTPTEKIGADSAVSFPVDI